MDNTEFNRGIARHEQKDYKGAIGIFSEIINRAPDDPKNAPVYLARGNAYYGINDEDNALADFTKSRSLDPQAYAEQLARNEVRIRNEVEYVKALMDDTIDAAERRQILAAIYAPWFFEMKRRQAEEAKRASSKP